MSARSVVIVEDQRGVICPTDGDLLLRKRQGRSGKRAAGDQEPLRLTASWLGRAGGPGLTGAGILPLPLLLAAGRRLAKQVRAHNTHRRDHEKPQDRQECEPDQEEGQRAHWLMCPWVPRRCGLLGGCRVGVCASAGVWISSGTVAIVRAASIDTVPAENKCRPAEGHLR